MYLRALELNCALEPLGGNQTLLQVVMRMRVLLLSAEYGIYRHNYGNMKSSQAPRICGLMEVFASLVIIHKSPSPWFCTIYWRKTDVEYSHISAGGLSRQRGRQIVGKEANVGSFHTSLALRSTYVEIASHVCVIREDQSLCSGERKLPS